MRRCRHLSKQPRVMALGSLVAGVVLALSMGSLAFAADPVAIPVQGPDRYQTAVQASMKFGTASTVVIATGELFPDALGGAALAGAVDGPILLTRSSSVPAEVLAEITRLGASKIYVLGSTAAVSAAAFNQLDAKIAGTPVRLGGADRYATASLVAAETIRLLGSGYQGGAFLATGLNFPDALAASPLMYAKGMPLILSNANGGFSVPAGVTKVKVLGSTSVVPASVVTALGAKYDGRLFGANRYATAKAVAEYGVAQGMVWNNLGVATGQNFPDALCAGPLLGEESSVLLLTTSATISSEPAAALGAHKNAIDQYYLFGGLPALSANVRAQIALILKRNVVPPPPAVGSHDLPALFCAGAGCHDTDLATIHLTDWNDDGETPKCVACHGAGITPTNNCQTCHPAAHEGTHVPITSAEGARLTCTLADCHGSSAIDIHPTCATCHNPTTVIAGKRTCQSCHGDFHPSLPAAHAITSGLCSAATCHGTDVTVMHTNDFRGTGNPPPGCAACHAPGVTPTTDCSVCHFDINAKHEAALQHATAESAMTDQSAACVSCHGSNLMAVLPATPPTTRHASCVCHADLIVAGQTTCESCHPTTDHASLHEPVTVSAACDGTGCHVGTNLILIHGASTCATCHESTAANVVAAIAAGDFTCESCHPSTDHRALHEVDIAGCAGCHDGNLVTEHEAQALGCAACHESTNAAVAAAIAAGNKTCTACHDLASHPYVAELHAATVASVPTSGTVVNLAGVPFRRVDGTIVTYGVDDGGRYEGNHTCGDCHLMDLMAEHSKPSSSVATEACSACHPSPRSEFTTWDTTCLQSGCHAAATMHDGMAAKHAWSPIASDWTNCGTFWCHGIQWSRDYAALHEEPTHVGPSWGVDFTGYQDGCSFCHTSNTAVPAKPVGCTDCHPANHTPAPLS